MKPPQIQRGIKSKHFSNRPRGADIGPVARMRDEHPESKVKRIRMAERTTIETRKKWLSKWSLSLGLATVAMIALAIFLWLRPYVFPDEEGTPLVAPVAPVKVRIDSKFPSPQKDAAIEIVKQATVHPDLAKVKALIRPCGTTPEAIVEYFKTAEARDGAVEHYEWLSSMDVNGLLIEGVLVSCKGKEKPAERLAFLTPDEAGKWKLDFDSYARTVTPPWPELLEKGAEQAQVRVFTGRDMYYNGVFSDESQWICYAMASPDMEELLRGYCKVGSPQAEAMERLFNDGRRLSRATMELRRVKDGEPKQFEITKLVAEDWIVP